MFTVMFCVRWSRVSAGKSGVLLWGDRRRSRGVFVVDYGAVNHYFYDMENRRVRRYPDPFLRLKSGEVGEVDESLQGLIQDMFAAMEEERGIGLAAPQIGVSKRVVVVSVEEKNFNRLALINPEIVQTSSEMDVMEEGCLSVPGVNADVERPIEAVVRGTTKNGRLVEISARGLLARVLQHEIDHLDGVLFIDRLSPKERKRIDKDLTALEQQYTSLASS
jgi:peptide deformylase